MQCYFLIRRSVLVLHVRVNGRMGYRTCLPRYSFLYLTHYGNV